MQLDPDCLRDILFLVEKKSSFGGNLSYSDFMNSDLVNKYDTGKIFYHIKQAAMSNLITKVTWTKDPDFFFSDLTPEGHKFINDIRNEQNWKKTKSVAKSIGSFSIDALKSIASEVVTTAINKLLGQ
ncbi:DUF2513 domain-containing protein [Lactobacillus sp. W8092]|nr:DUF2513 domain-containing protein [Lactobacillus sp. W8092]